MWQNLPKELGEAVGFVYLITNKISGKKYVGRKIFKNSIRRKPLKGYSRVRIDKVDSNWRDYFGSSKELLEDVKKFGEENFTREVLSLAYSKRDLAYKELLELVERRVLFREDFYNKCISATIYKN